MEVSAALDDSAAYVLNRAVSLGALSSSLGFFCFLTVSF